MKKISLFFVYLFTLFSIIFVPTLSKYQSKEVGEIFHADFTKPTAKVGIYIKNIEEVNKNDNVSASYTFPTNVSTTSNGSTTVTYKITVHNNTDVTYWYIGQYYDSDKLNNSLIENGITVVTKDKLSDTTSTFDNKDWVPPQTERDFYVTYTFPNNTTQTLINFKFDIKMDSIYDGFLAVLNDNTSNKGYQYLASEFDKKYKESGSTVIGNIGDDKAIFDHIFGGPLTINVDGKDVPVTVLVERKNVDGTAEGDSYSNGGPTGCEYTVYITVDDLSSSTGKATVYAISYSCTDGVWYQLGQLYEGTTNKEDYSSTTEGYQGSIDVDSWVATTKTYNVVEYSNGKISYNVASKGNGDQYDLLDSLEELMSCKDQDFFNDINNSGILKYVYNNILKKNKTSTHPAIVQLRTVFENMSPYYTIKNDTDVDINRDGNITRSRLIPHLQALSEALDYYYQTFEK